MTGASAQSKQKVEGRGPLAPGPYLGYGLQAVRLCFHLLNSDDSANVSIEYADDVAIHEQPRVVLEQTKSALAQNPISNWAIDLWKTFGNWADQISAGTVDPMATEFRLYVTPPHSGEFVEMLNAARNSAQADQVLDTVRTRLQALPRKPAAYKHIKRLLSLEIEQQRRLVMNFRLESEHDDPVLPIRKFFSSAVDPRMAEQCALYALGHAKTAVEELIRAGKPAVLNAGEFRTSVIAFVRKNDLNGLLVSLAPQPSDELVARTHASSPTFVKQLVLIDLARDDQLRAVSDFLQASVNKTKWAEAGQIVQDSLAELDRDLVREHSMFNLEIQETNASLDPKSRGRVLYARCLRSKVKLEGRELPGHFIPGCYHDLADRLVLGWHRDFKSLLSEEVDKS